MNCQSGFLEFPNATWLFSWLLTVHVSYGEVHPYLCIALCLSGLVINAMTVVVLTRPVLVNPVNTLLSAIALCDSGVMISNTVFVSRFLMPSDDCDLNQHSYGWRVFLLVHLNVSVIFHSTSIWLTVALATVRVVSVMRSTAGSGELLKVKDTIWLAVAILSILFIINLPSILIWNIVNVPLADMNEMMPFCLFEDSTFVKLIGNITDDNQINQIATDFFPLIYRLDVATEQCGLYRILFWINGIAFKCLPCLLMCIAIALLLNILHQVYQRRIKLGLSGVTRNAKGKKTSGGDRTTLMLTAVLSVFLFTELPQGVVTIMSGLFDKVYFTGVYQNLGDLMDMLALVNSLVNFIIYCTMSKRFRQVFSATFFSPFFKSQRGPITFEATTRHYETRPSINMTPLDSAVREKLLHSVAHDSDDHVALKVPKYGTHLTVH